MVSKKRRAKADPLVLDATVVGVDSNYDIVTAAGFAYREAHVYPYLVSKGFSLRKLQGPLARRIYVAPEARKAEVVYVTGIGHGQYDHFDGDHGEPVWELGKYDPGEAAGKIVHLLACRTGGKLGPGFVATGCRAYFGYDENFAVHMPQQAIFFECDSEIDRAFARGLSAARVYKRVRALFDRRIASLRSNGKLYVAAMLEFNRDHLRCPSSGGSAWGDPRAKLGS